MLIPDKYLSYFPEDGLTISDLWRPIKRFKKLSYSEIGVISSISAPIARGKIPILYVSTYLSAFMMVQATHVKTATVVLESLKVKVEHAD